MTKSTYYSSSRSNGSNGSGSIKGALAAGAAGFGLGMLAAVGRKAAMQAPTYAAGDWQEGLKAEHVAARALFNQLAELEIEDHEKRATLLISLQYALSKHNIQEEYVVYASMGKHGDATGATALHAEHADMKQGLFDLEMLMKEKSPQFSGRLADVRADFEAHVQEEEDIAFPQLASSLTDVESKELTNRMNREGFKVA
jgi:hypothetical protein